MRGRADKVTAILRLMILLEGAVFACNRNDNTIYTVHRYGAYGMHMPIDYHPGHACMLERGWVLAFAHVRGGGERGKRWHADGRGQNKWNSFRDFEVGGIVYVHIPDPFNGIPSRPPPLPETYIRDRGKIYHVRCLQAGVVLFVLVLHYYNEF